MSLLNQIQEDLTSPSSNLSDILRRAKVLASKLKSSELRNWVKLESEGYENREDLPDYRQMHLAVLGTYKGPSGGGINNAPIPLMNMPEDVKEWATKFEIYDNVATLEEMLRKGKDSFQFYLPPELTRLIDHHIGRQPPLILVETFQTVPRYTLTGIVDNIKNRLLDFVLELQEQGINPDDPESNETKPDVVREAVVNYILGDHNVVAIGENISQEVSTVQKGDINSLMDHLKAQKVPGENLEELKSAILAETQAETGKLGPKVSAWIGGMVAKAASGAWKIGVPAASAMLQKGIESYYGT